MAKLVGGIFPRLIALFPLLFPLYLFRGAFSGIPVTLPEVVLGVLFLFFLFQRYEFHARDWKLWPVFLFASAAALGVLIVFIGGDSATPRMVDGTEFPAQMKALGILKGWILAPLLYFFMARTVFRDKASMIPLALRALLLSGVVLSLLALQQVWTGEYLTLDGRASGPFESANYLSLYLGPVVLYSVLAFKQSTKKRERVFLAASGAICVLGLYFTYSYAAWLAVFAGLALAVVLFFAGSPSVSGVSLTRQSFGSSPSVSGKKKKVFWVTLGVLIVLGLGMVLSEIGSEKFTQFLEYSERSSTSVRLQVYEISLNLALQNPLPGIGLGQFEQQYQEVAVSVLGEAPFEWNMLHPHNIFLAFWLNMGLAGLVAFVWLCGKALLWLTEEDTKERPLAALMVVVILVHGLFDTPYFKNDLAFQFWLLMAILL